VEAVAAVAPPLELLAEPDRVRLALSPLRRRLLALLAEPASATELAARLDLSRQRVNYHLKALEAGGLVEEFDRRQRRGFVERILRVSAAAFVVDPGVVGGQRRTAHAAARAQDRFAAEHLVAVAGATVRDVARMQVSAERAGARLLTFTIEAEVAFGEPADIERFATEVADLLAGAVSRFDKTGGRRYRIVAGGHPAPGDKEEPDD
jgi:DNA-binding transcriptional ArsR family regulator